MSRILFFTGKGGVGKSTNASIFAYEIAKAGYDVLLCSLDPAHNLHDVFQKKIGSRPRKFAPHLWIQETDLDQWVKKYLKQTEEEFKQVYKYQEAFNLQKYFRTLKYSPGLEEYAVLLALENTVIKNEDKKFIIFDTPPTALTLKFLALPDVSLLWLSELTRFRRMILEKKEIVTKIHRGTRGDQVEKDRILNKIRQMTSQYSSLSKILKSKDHTKIFVVLNPTKLSLEESRDIYKELNRLGFENPSLLLNKCNPDDSFTDKIRAEFPGASLYYQPRRQEEITGQDILDRQSLPLALEELLN